MNLLVLAGAGLAYDQHAVVSLRTDLANSPPSRTTPKPNWPNRTSSIDLLKQLGTAQAERIKTGQAIAVACCCPRTAPTPIADAKDQGGAAELAQWLFKLVCPGLRAVAESEVPSTWRGL